MQLLNVTNTPVKLGTSPFFVGAPILVTGPAASQLQGSTNGSDGWASLGAANAVGTFQLVPLTANYVRASTSVTIQLIGN